MTPDEASLWLKQHAPLIRKSVSCDPDRGFKKQDLMRAIDALGSVDCHTGPTKGPSPPRPGRLVTAAEIQSYGTCRDHRAWKLLCCSGLVERGSDKWYWKP